MIDESLNSSISSSYTENEERLYRQQQQKHHRKPAARKNGAPPANVEDRPFLPPRSVSPASATSSTMLTSTTSSRLEYAPNAEDYAPERQDLLHQPAHARVQPHPQRNGAPHWDPVLKPAKQSDLQANGRVQNRIDATRGWLENMQAKVEKDLEKEDKEQRSAGLLCSVARARSLSRSTGIMSFLDGTPFLTPDALERYNLDVVQNMEDETLRKIRDKVFAGNEKLYATLLYCEGVWDNSTNCAYNRAARRRRVNSTKQFNTNALEALQKCFSFGLGDEILNASGQVDIAPEEYEEEYQDDEIEQ